MKLGSISMEKGRRQQWVRGLTYLGAGAVSALCCLDGRAPLTVALSAALGPGGGAFCATVGGGLGALVLLDFGPALRCWGILILVQAVLYAFRDTQWLGHPAFRPLSAAGCTLSVELAYLLELGVSLSGVLRLVGSATLTGLLCHYCEILTQRETPRRGERREAERQRQRLRLSAEALRSLRDSLVAPKEPKEENPAVIFDRAAQVVCRGCALGELCWGKEYVATFNAFNDATPAILQRGRAEGADFAAYFSGRCIHFPQLLSAINTETTAHLLRRQHVRELQQERQRTRGQYAQLTELVAQAMAPAEPVSGGKERAYRVSVLTEPKAGQRLCGDSAVYFKTGDHALCLLLSDGCGSGREAQRESQLAVNLLRQFLLAGIAPETALATLNGALNLRGEGDFTTVDLLTVGLIDDQAALYKYGAAPTYVKRRGGVRRLTGDALPAGLQSPSRCPAPTRFPLGEDCFVVMVSDGVADRCDDGWLLDLLTGWQGEEPEELSGLILKETQRRRRGDDDCSVLCLRLFDRGKGKV
jgi:stage II sporulation protein E